MKPQSSDTNLIAEEVQLSLIRQASIAKRISAMRSLSQTVIQLSRRAIAKANPGKSELELDLLFVAHHYGEDLAMRLRKYLEQMNK